MNITKTTRRAVINALRQHKITLGDTAAMDDEEILMIGGIGQKGLAWIRESTKLRSGPVEPLSGEVVPIAFLIKRNWSHFAITLTGWDHDLDEVVVHTIMMRGHMDPYEKIKRRPRNATETEWLRKLGFELEADVQ